MNTPPLTGATTMNTKTHIFYLFQVRRIAIIIFSVASGRLGVGTVRRMLDGEIKDWPEGLDMADPNGLYLGNNHVFLDLS